MRDAAERLLAPQLRTIVRLIDEPLLQPIYDLASPRLAFGRVAIIGDAAFVARPHVAAGVSKAADDAAALTAALDEDEVEVSLQRYEAESTTGRSIASSSVRAISAHICRRRKAPRRAYAPPATASRRPCLPKRRGSIFCMADRAVRAEARGNYVVTSSRKLAAAGLTASSLG